MPIVVRNPNPNDKLHEYVMLELQGDLECRDEDLKDLTNQFVGDLFYNKFSQPILIIGHHILYGKEKNLEKPFAVLEKISIDPSLHQNLNFNGNDSIANSQPYNASFSILDDTINIENRTKPQVEYHVRAVIKKKILFNQRPRPIISSTLTKSS